MFLALRSLAEDAPQVLPAYRSPYVAPLQPAVFDIALLGDSLIWPGLTFWQEEARVAIQRTAKRPVRVYTSSHPGQTVLEAGIPYVAEMAALRPAAALIEFCHNDYQRLTLAQAALYTTQVLDVFRAANPDIALFLMTMNPLIAVAPITPEFVATHATFHAQYRTLAVRENVGLIDNEAVWGAATLTEIPDGAHPTMAAARRVTIPTVTAALAPLVA